jgi:hypothetical protein
MPMRYVSIAVGLVVGILSFRIVAAQSQPQEKLLEEMTGPELLNCAATKLCNNLDWDIANALRKRYDAKALIALYPNQPALVRQVIVYALYHDRGKDIATLMRQAAFAGLKPGLTTEDNNYFPLQYLAQRCDPDALRELNRPDNFAGSYPVACMQWQHTLSAFGKCGYKDAIAHLAMSLDAACVNNIDAARHSLRQLMPHSPCWKKGDPKDNFQQETVCYATGTKSADAPPPTR